MAGGSRPHRDGPRGADGGSRSSADQSRQMARHWRTGHAPDCSAAETARSRNARAPGSVEPRGPAWRILRLAIPSSDSTLPATRTTNDRQALVEDELRRQRGNRCSPGSRRSGTRWLRAARPALKSGPVRLVGRIARIARDQPTQPVVAADGVGRTRRRRVRPAQRGCRRSCGQAPSSTPARHLEPETCRCIIAPYRLHRGSLGMARPPHKARSLPPVLRRTTAGHTA